MNIETFKLSKEHVVYRLKYVGEYGKDIFIKRIDENKNVIYKKHFKNIKNFEDKFLIESKEFKFIDRYVLNALEIIENKKS